MNNVAYSEKTSPGHRQSPIKVCIIAPSIEVLGGQSRQAERLMKGLASESSGADRLYSAQSSVAAAATVHTANQVFAYGRQYARLLDDAPGAPVALRRDPCVFGLVLFLPAIGHATLVGLRLLESARDAMPRSIDLDAVLAG